MGNWNYIKNIAVKNIKMILHSSRFYIVLFAVFACLTLIGVKVTLCGNPLAVGLTVSRSLARLHRPHGGDFRTARIQKRGGDG